MSTADVFYCRRLFSYFHSNSRLLYYYRLLTYSTCTGYMYMPLSSCFRKGDERQLELDFESMPLDVINPESQELDVANLRTVRDYEPVYRRSLRVCPLVQLVHVDRLLDLFCTTIDATVRTGIHVLVRLVYIFLGVLKYPVFEATHAHTAAR